MSAEALKVTASHLARNAYLYIRQSTLRQVLHNTESTARQYDLRGKAISLGWAASQITVTGIDQGHSGASAADREGFQQLVAEVSLGRAGIVLGLECSRLARNNADWHQLLEICAMTGTLICDEDGLYDPRDFNDRLILGMKGQISEALCRYRHKASYADFSVMPTMRCECAADLAGSPGRVGIIPAHQWYYVSILPGQELILLSGRADRPEEEFMMAKTKPSRPEVAGPLAEYADGFRAELARLGYTPLSAACQMRLMAHLSRWMTAEGLSTRVLDMPAAERYFAARRSAGYANERTVEALGPLLGYLRGLGAVLFPPAEPATETSLLLDRFGAYLTSERALAPATVALNVCLARPFLQQRALERDGHLDLGQLSAGEVRAFVLDQARRQPRSAKRIVTALRSLLRFLHVDGVLAVPLAGAVPSPAGHALAGLPKALEPGQVEAMLASCDPATGTGRRDRAVLLLLSRMGLRAGEAAGLGLDDIDWRRGELTVRGKGGRRDRLPLPADVGAAIVAYLRDGRPAGALDRTVFIAAQAPREALSYTGITTIVADAAARAGIPGPVHAHRLRHSAATAMLRGGGSLTEIGQALRHARPATTAIYAKVDIGALRPLGRPWPGQEESA